jgi:hypothetical protein
MLRSAVSQKLIEVLEGLTASIPQHRHIHSGHPKDLKSHKQEAIHPGTRGFRVGLKTFTVTPGFLRNFKTGDYGFYNTTSATGKLANFKHNVEKIRWI